MLHCISLMSINLLERLTLKFNDAYSKNFKANLYVHFLTEPCNNHITKENITRKGTRDSILLTLKYFYGL